MTDHARAARQAVIAMRKHYMETGMTNTGTLDDEIDALADERDALLAYATYLEGIIERADLGYRPEAGRRNHNVAHLLDPS